MKVSERQRLLIVFLQLVIIALLVMSKCHGQQTKWVDVDIGLQVGEYYSPQPSTIGNSLLTIVKIDPNEYDFNLFNDTNGKTVKEWSEEHNLSVVVNAGMYDGNGINMGYMKQYSTISNPRLNKDNAILAFNPKDNTVPSIMIIDLKYMDWDKLKDKYNSYTQSIRMVSLMGNNLWSKVNKMWSVVVVAMDKNNNVLFIHCRSPYTMHDFINILLGSDLNIRNVMYLEGGPEASLFINHNNEQYGLVGSYETGFYDDSNRSYWHIPNIIGVIKKE